uniref:Uncharacterized protein n=1 Tax=viral metagenome TaxID=1070528 RepID=A0A6C0LEL3_9ZZZZ
MGKEKVTEEVAKTLGIKSNVLLQYAPLIIGLVCLVVCYLLFKKIQTLNSHSDTVSKIEKQYANFVREQSEVNSINGKKFNAMISQINQLSYVIQNSSSRESNTVVSQMSPERDNGQELPTQHTQPPQREMMPTSVIQTNFPMKGESSSLPIPVSTTNKKEIEKLPTIEQQKQPKQGGKNNNNKKVIDLQTLKEEVLIEEASSDED